MKPVATAMKVTTVRFGVDLWRLLEREAAYAGVSVSQYIREAALARAAAAGALRGEDPFEQFAGAAARSSVPERELIRDAGREAAMSTRERAQTRRDESLAARAESEQAIRHSRELAVKSAAARRRGR